MIPPLSKKVLHFIFKFLSQVLINSLDLPESDIPVDPSARGHIISRFAPKVFYRNI
ncbi:hypothetical protein Psfp_03180 [Pelotomaculum sp. FP]|nr:hypothetical protein Psfp_03180 [Pelotomaculum sp. FP]